MRSPHILPFAVVLVSVLIVPALSSSAALDVSDTLRVQGSGTAPQLGFACCDQGIDKAQALFADPTVSPALQALHAEVAVALTDLSPARAALVQKLNQSAIPAVAWIILPADQGYYINADTAPQTAARIAAFEHWTRDNHLRWAAVGLDIEPNFGELSAFKGHPGRLVAAMLHRSFDTARIVRAKALFSALIARLHSDGYTVQTYILPYQPAERRVHSTLLDRLLGTVDVRGDQEFLMIYTSFAPPAVRPGAVWALGPQAHFIALGSTLGDGQPGSLGGPLDWSDFSRDLLVASHFSRIIAIYDLEGCVRQGFLPRIQSIDWSQSVLLPAVSLHHASERLNIFLPALIFVASNILYILLAVLLLLIGLFIRRRQRSRARRATEAASL
ncbi:MAG: hypothetical protein WAN28_20705 [Terracidiphilus sp.]